MSSAYSTPNGHGNNNTYPNHSLHGPSITSTPDPLIVHAQQQQHQQHQQHQHQQQHQVQHQHSGNPVTQSYQYDPQPLQHPSAQLQQNASPYGNDGVNGHDSLINQSPGTPSMTGGAGGEASKANRLRKACDSCSIRKVKCDESGPPCRACASLDIPCTFDRPSRRRGPPNRHAEAIKKRRLESPVAGNYSSPPSPTNVAATLASFSSHAVLSAESICPLSTLELLVDDFFTYVHPLCPFPHEPSFRAAFRNREDVHNPIFLALLASMVGILVASFPRKPRLHLKAQGRENMFPNSISLVERCHKIAVEARGPGYLDKDLSVYAAATSYFLGLVGAYTFNWRQCRLYFGETLNIIRVLRAHKNKDLGAISMGALPITFGAESQNFNGQSEEVDFIRQEIGRRLFWVMFVGIRSMQQIGATHGELLIPPPTPNEPYPPLPMEVDDDYIYVGHVNPQPEGLISKLTGFNMNIQVYMTCTPLTTMEMAYGIDEIFDYERQKKVLSRCLNDAKRVLEKLPTELMLQSGSETGEFLQADRNYFPPMPDFPGARSDGSSLQSWNETSPEARRKLQYEIQKANIYISQLGTRSYIVEKYWSLQEAYKQLKAKSADEVKLGSPGLMATGLDGMLPKSTLGNTDNIESIVTNERENIVKDLMKALGSISQVSMEPNGGSLVNKIRSIASTLIDTPRNRKGPLALRAEEYLGRFLEVLMKLERISPSNCRSDSADGAIDEEEELRNWADLREYQTRFAQSGGFLNEL